MPSRPAPASPRSQFWAVIVVLAMIAIPSAITLHRAKVAPAIAANVFLVDPVVLTPASADYSPYGYTTSLLLFVLPIIVVGVWLVPQDGVKISKKAFGLTIAVLFPLGVLLDFFFANSFLKFPNPAATLRIPHAPALHGGVPIEEYLFYFTGFVVVLLIYIWLDEYWLKAYSVPNESCDRIQFDRLLQFHPKSLILAVVLIAAAILDKKFILHQPGFPGYFTFLALGALLPSSALFPMALPVINWRAFSLTLFIILLTSLLWEATLAIPYGWWRYNDLRMAGIYITAWNGLPIEAVFVWIAVTYETTIVYEIIRRWKSSGRPVRSAFLGH